MGSASHLIGFESDTGPVSIVSNATPLPVNLVVASGGVLIPFTFARGGTLLTPQNPISVMVWRAPFACTVTAVKGFAKGATGTTINARKNEALTHLASDLTISSTDAWLDGGAVQNQSYLVGDELEIMLTGIGGSPTQVAVQVEYARS